MHCRRGKDAEEPGQIIFLLKLLDDPEVESKRAGEIDLKALRDQGPSEMPEDPCFWGIQLSQLQHLRSYMCADGAFVGEDGNFRDLNMYEVNTKYVKPLTKDLNISVGVLYNRNTRHVGRRANVFISHAWPEPFCGFVASLSSGIGSQTPLALDDVAWVCTFGVYQNMTAEQISAAIASPLDSPFAKVLRKVDQVVVVFNERVSLYTRVWCVYEGFLALDWGKFVRAIGLTPDWQQAAKEICDKPENEWVQDIQLFTEKHKIKVEDAKASVESDKISIMKSIEGKENEVNDRTNILAIWVLRDILTELSDQSSK